MPVGARPQLPHVTDDKSNTGRMPHNGVSVKPATADFRQLTKIRLLRLFWILVKKSFGDGRSASLMRGRFQRRNHRSQEDPPGF